MSNDKINYLNSVISDKDRIYHGPKSLFKYRPFDSFAFDMLEKVMSIFVLPRIWMTRPNAIPQSISID